MISSSFGIESVDWYLNIAAPSSSQGDQSKLEGPEESFFERSPGVGKEERPPIAVVVQSLSRVCHLTVFVLITVNGKMICLAGLVM